MGPRFWITESEEPDGASRLTLFGELDLTCAEELDERIQELRRQGKAVRLDLSELSFIDSSGIRVVTRARLDSDKAGWAFEVDPHVSPVVKRPLELLGLGDVLWSKTPD
jgi:anti-sigma B factor antagonist